MKTIGLIGGMSWESTLPYYKIINEAVRKKLGGFHSAKIILYSLDFAEIEALQGAEDWEAAARLLIQAAKSLEMAGAQCLLICSNTMHKVAPTVENAINLPLLHIADVTAQAARDAGFRKLGLLGTRFTMAQDFYVGRLAENFGLSVLVPGEKDRIIVHEIIFNELCQGKIEPSSKAAYRRIIADLVAQGAEAIILGCTEISLLIDASDATVPLFDTTAIHAQSAVRLALENHGMPDRHFF